MRFSLRDRLIFINVIVAHQNQVVEVPDVIVDTGSATTVLSADYIESIGITPEPRDRLYTVRGIGGVEVVFSRQIDTLRIGSREVNHCLLEIGGMDYGFAINGILGMDILLQTRAIIDLAREELIFDR